jgi:hypothetical protein
MPLMPPDPLDPPSPAAQAESVKARQILEVHAQVLINDYIPAGSIADLAIGCSQRFDG